MGDFGVDGDFYDGEQNNIVLANEFNIVKQLKHIKELIKDDFPFFKGDIALEQEIEVDDVNQLLVFDDIFQMIDVYVNNQFVDCLLFNYKLDLSKHLKIGKNTIRIVLTVPNRNLLGIHHHNQEEPLSIGPYSFERFKTWQKDGTSPLFKKRYSFIKTII